MLLSAVHAVAQNRGVHTTHYTTRDGMASNVVYTIMQDHLGYLWLGTNVGLTRFDGYRFTNFYHEVDGHWRTENIAGIAEDTTQHRLLVTNMDGDVWHYDLASQHSELLRHYDSRVYALLTDPQGRLWTGLRGGVWVGDCKYPTTNRHLNTADGLAANVIFHLFRAPDGTVWVSSLDGGLIAAREQADGSFIFQTFLTDEKVHQVDADAQGHLWVATESGIFVREAENFRHVYDGAKCVAICCTGEGQVLAATIGQGLLLIENGRL